MNHEDAVQAARQSRLEQLREEAEQDRIKAAALDALAELIHARPAPVVKYEPIWLAVERRLRHEAHLLRAHAVLAVQREDDVRAAIDAHDRWVPKASDPPIVADETKAPCDAGLDW